MSELVKKMQSELFDEDTNKDLVSGEWLFGRGSCDMKGGIAVQLALLEEYSQNPDAGNLLFVSVPDEESFSAGMRGALWLFEEFKKDWDLDYKLLINCEPNEQIGGKQVVSVGSVGKLLPVVLVQGKAVQIGSYYEGVNPIVVLSEIVCATEGDLNLVEICDTEKTVPPVWNFMRDLKESYDFSLPQRAVGYCNILTFYKTPADIMQLFLDRCRGVVTKMQVKRKSTIETKVMPYSDLLILAQKKKGFDIFLAKLKQDIERKVRLQGIDYPSVTIQVMQEVLNFANVVEPIIIVAFAPPYYPAANSVKLASTTFTEVMKTISSCLPVIFKQYFLGVSDCSYCGVDRPIAGRYYATNTPVWGSLYSFDIGAVNRLKMPFVLLGPWGKSLHQRTERVNIASLTLVLPGTLKTVIKEVWDRDIR
jgi:arginine utilization protein RocB